MKPIFYLYIILFILLGNHSNAQDIFTFKGRFFKMITMTKDNKKVKEEILGKNVTIFYDKEFDSYDINFFYENGNKENIHLGNKVTNKYGVLHRDKDGIFYVVEDAIKTKRSLAFSAFLEEGEFNIVFTITEITLRSTRK